MNCIHPATMRSSLILLFLAAVQLPCIATAQSLGDLTDSRSGNAAFFRFTEPGDIKMTVNVWGGVTHPGLYEVPENTRLNTIITLAGGLPLSSVHTRGSRFNRTLHIVVLRPSGEEYGVAYERTMQDNIIVTPDNPMLRHNDFLMIEMIERETTPFTWRDGLSIATAVAALALAFERVLHAAR